MSNPDHREFINNWLDLHYETSSVDAEFHYAFHKKFGGKFTPKNWGSEPVHAAMQVLKEMYKEGLIYRSIVGLGTNWQPGFPKWVYSYSKRR